MKQSVRFVLTLIVCLVLSLSGVLVNVPAARAADTGTWTQLPLYASTVHCLAINPLTPATLYAGTCGSVCRSTDSGTTWTAVNTGLTDAWVTSLAINPATPSTLYAGTEGGICRSTNSGTTWTVVNSGLNGAVLSLAINPLTPATLYAGTDDGVFQYDVVSSYALTTTASPSSGGTITKSPDQSSYAPGTIVTLTAIPAAGYTFTGWEWNKSDSPTIPPIVTMDADKTVTATFTAIPTYTLTPSAGTGGTITPNTVQTVLQGGSTTFTIVPAAGYHIADVSVDGVSQGIVSSYSFTNVTSNRTISARFEQETKQTVMVLQIGNSMFTVNGGSMALDSPPVIKNGRTLVPIRAIIEALGGTVGWDGMKREATVTLGKKTIALWIGKSVATVNGVSTPIDSTNAKVVPEIISSRTMLPLRFISENLGCSIVWVDATKTITITYQQ